MATIEAFNENDIGKAARLEFIKSILKANIGLVPLEIRPVAYEDDYPFPYNNFVYAVKTDPGASYGSSLVQQPGTCTIPTGLFEFILRLPNATSGYNNRVRVENEVAALALAREALQQKFPGLVPRVFAWSSANSGQGWILQELMVGSPLLDDFELMKDDAKSLILKQMAEILAVLQNCSLPASVHDFGGLQFGPSGEFVSGPLSIMDAGPFSTYEAFVQATIKSKLAKTNADPQVRGWRANGIRARLNTFVEHGVPEIMADMGNWPKALVHADFTPDNFLYNKENNRLTALLDFDFAHIATFADEFFRSLGDSIGQFPSSRQSEELSALRKAMLTGFPEPLPETNDQVDWPSAKAWDDALFRMDAIKPSTIENIDTLSDLFWLSGQLLPFKLCNKTVVENSTLEQLQRWRHQGEALLIEFLDDYGY